MKRTYNIPLRRAFGKKPKYKRAPTAVRAVHNFLVKHMKATDVRIGKNLNEELWYRGIKNPPPKVSVEAEIKEGIVYVELRGHKYDEPTAEDIKALKEAAAKAKAPKLPFKKEAKPEVKKEVKTETKVSEEKKEEKPKAETKISESSQKKKPVKKTAKKTTKKVSK